MTLRLGQAPWRSAPGSAGYATQYPVGGVLLPGQFVGFGPAAGPPQIVSSPSVRGTPTGPAMTLSSAGTALRIASGLAGTAAVFARPGSSLIWHGLVSANNGTSNTFIAGRWYAGSAIYAGAFCLRFYSAGEVIVEFIDAGGTIRSYTSTLVIPLGKPFTVLAQFGVDTITLHLCCDASSINNTEVIATVALPTTVGSSLVAGARFFAGAPNYANLAHTNTRHVLFAWSPVTLPADLARRPFDLFAARSVWAPKTAGGGPTYTATLTESAAAVDAQSAVSVGGAAADESASAADAMSAAATLLSTITESAALADALAAAFIAVVAQAEAVAAADAASTGPVYSGGASEAASAADAITAAATLVAAVAEAAAAGDAATAAATLVALLTEPAIAADTVAAAMPGTYTVSITELAAALDAVAAALANAIELSAPPAGHRAELASRIRAAIGSRASRLSTRTR